MNDYQVTMVFDYAYIGLAVFADDEDQAVANAYTQLSESDISIPEPNEINIELKGVFA
jgi:hypothetical protein